MGCESDSTPVVNQRRSSVYVIASLAWLRHWVVKGNNLGNEGLDAGKWQLARLDGLNRIPYAVLPRSAALIPIGPLVLKRSAPRQQRLGYYSGGYAGPQSPSLSVKACDLAVCLPLRALVSTSESMQSRGGSSHGWVQNSSAILEQSRPRLQSSSMPAGCGGRIRVLGLRVAIRWSPGSYGYTRPLDPLAYRTNVCATVCCRDKS
jgi:hypothetical protein